MGNNPRLGRNKTRIQEEEKQETEDGYSSGASKAMEVQSKKMPPRARSLNKGAAQLAVKSKSEVIKTPQRVKKVSPESLWKRVSLDIRKQDDWEKQLQAVQQVREFSTSHPQFFSGSDPYQHSIIQELIELGSSLRSSLSKNALETMQILFSNLKKGMDINVDLMVPTLVKNAGHTNRFVAAESEKALIAACANCSEAKVATAALTLVNSRTNSVKQKLMLALTQIVERMGLKAKSFREIDRIAAVFGKSINEAAQEVRQEAKKGLLTLQSVFDGKDLENLLQRNLTDREYEKIDEFYQ